MRARCIDNSLARLPKKMHTLAFTQDERGVVDLSPGKKYQVYGIRKNKNGAFYLILTDTVHSKLPWWMPAAFFNDPEGDIPSTWQMKVWGKLRKDSITAHPAYFGAIADIEDATPQGYQIFKVMNGR